MVYTDVKNEMVKVTEEHKTKLKSELAQLDASDKNRRKAVMIQLKLCENCESFIQLDFTGRYFEVREQRVFEQLNYFEERKADYQSFSQEDKKSFLVYAFAVSMVRQALLDGRKKAIAGETDAQRRFENSIAVGIIESILKDWEAVWLKVMK